MHSSNIDWKRRYANFAAALAQLSEADDLRRRRGLSRLEILGSIRTFSLTYWLAWNTLKDYLTFQGVADVFDAQDAATEARKCKLVDDAGGWEMMLTDGNRTPYSYNAAIAAEIIENIHLRYIVILRALATRLLAHLDDD